MHDRPPELNLDGEVPGTRRMITVDEPANVARVPITIAATTGPTPRVR